MPVYYFRVSFDNRLNAGGRQTEYLEIDCEAQPLADLQVIPQLNALLTLQQSPLSRVSNLKTEVIPSEQAGELIVTSHPKPDEGYYTVAEVAHQTTLSLKQRK